MAVFHSLTARQQNYLTTHYPNQDFSKFIACGGTRMVFEYDDKHVIKYATDSYQNKEEWDKTQAVVGTAYESRIFRIVKHAPDFLWVVQEKAFGTFEDDPLYHALYPEIREVAPHVNVYDVQDHNIGKREDGSWAFIDLGL